MHELAASMQTKNKNAILYLFLTEFYIDDALFFLALSSCVYINMHIFMHIYFIFYTVI